MMQREYLTPVLFLVFNRPETTERVLEAIRAVKPQRMFVAADGPRPGHAPDRQRCARVLEVVEKGIDWDCDVRYLKRDENLGCRRAVSSAISWFYDAVGEGVILEDDCLPATGFFQFCSVLLERFRDDPRIAHIGGFNCQNGRNRGSGSYYFSRYFHVWGWATWRRAWLGYDVDMHDYRSFVACGGLRDLFDRPSVRDFWKEILDETAAGKVDTWDYQWAYANFKESRLAVVPQRNMVENIGFGTDATHTSSRSRRAPAEERPAEEIVHPEFMLPSKAADDFTYRHHLHLGLFHDAKHALKRFLGIQ